MPQTEGERIARLEEKSIARDRELAGLDDKLEEIKQLLKDSQEKADETIGNLAGRVCQVETVQESFRPVKKFYDNAAAAALGIMITLGLTVIGLAYYIYEHMKS